MKKYNVGLVSLLLFFATGAAIGLEVRLENKTSDPILVIIQYQTPGIFNAFILNKQQSLPIRNAKDVDAILMANSNRVAEHYSQFLRQVLPMELIPTMQPTSQEEAVGVYDGKVFTEICEKYKNATQVNVRINIVHTHGDWRYVLKVPFMKSESNFREYNILDRL
jgi:hypothetical protein